MLMLAEIVERAGVLVFKDFEEEKHPRDPKGQFAESGGASEEGGKLSSDEKSSAHSRLDEVLSNDANHEEPTGWPRRVEGPGQRDLTPEGMTAIGWAPLTTPGLVNLYTYIGRRKMGVVMVDPRELQRSQSHVPVNGLRAYVDDLPDELPDVTLSEDFRYEGTMHVLGGHTRISAQLLAGREKIPVRMWSSRKVRKADFSAWKDFDEAKHPRDERGRFGEGEGGDDGSPGMTDREGSGKIPQARAAVRFIPPSLLKITRNFGVRFVASSGPEVEHRRAAYKKYTGAILVGKDASPEDVVHEIGHAFDQAIAGKGTFRDRRNQGINVLGEKWSDKNLAKPLSEDLRDARRMKDFTRVRSAAKVWEYAFSGTSEAFAHAFASHLGKMSSVPAFTLEGSDRPLTFREVFPRTFAAVSKVLKDHGAGPPAKEDWVAKADWFEQVSKDFDEGKHPRDASGKFSEGGEGGERKEPSKEELEEAGQMGLPMTLPDPVEIPASEAPDYEEKPEDEEESPEGNDPDEEDEEGKPKGDGVEGTVGPSDQDSPEQKTLRDRAVVASRDLGGGISQSEVLQLDDKSMVVWKPSTGEASFFEPGVPAGEQYQREALAYDVAKLVGLDDLVPATTIREHEGVFGSVQAFLPGAANDGREGKNFEEDVRRAMFFDYVMGNLDRHAKNWMKDKDGKLRLIDNGLILSSNPRDNLRFVMNEYGVGRFHQGETIPPEVQKAWKGKWPKIKKAMSLRGINEKAVKLAEGRFREAVAGGMRWDELGQWP